MVQRVIKQKTQFRNNPVGLTKFNSVDAGKSQAIINLAGQAKQIIEEVRIPQRQQEAKQDAAALTVEDLLNTDEEGNPTVVNTDHLRGKGSVYSRTFKESVLSNQYDAIENKIGSKFASLAAANKFTSNGVAQFEAEASNFLLELSQKLKGNLEVFAGNAGKQKLLDTSAALQNARAARTYQQTHEKAVEGLQSEINNLRVRIINGDLDGEGQFVNSSDAKVQEFLNAPNGILERLERTKEGPFRKQAELDYQKFKGMLGINSLKKLTSTLTRQQQTLVNKFLNNEDGVKLHNLKDETGKYFVPKEIHEDIKAFIAIDDLPFRNQMINDIKQTYTKAIQDKLINNNEEQLEVKLSISELITTSSSETISDITENITAGGSDSFFLRGSSGDIDRATKEYMANFENKLRSNPLFKTLSTQQVENILTAERQQAPTRLAQTFIQQSMISNNLTKPQKQMLAMWLRNDDENQKKALIKSLTEGREDSLNIEGLDKKSFLGMISMLDDYKKSNRTKSSYEQFLKTVSNANDQYKEISDAERKDIDRSIITSEVGQNIRQSKTQQENPDLLEEVLNETQLSLIQLTPSDVQEFIKDIDNNHFLSENNLDLIKAFLNNPSKFEQMAVGQGVNPEQAFNQMASILNTLHALPNLESGKPQGQSLIHKINNNEWRKELSFDVERVTSLFGALNAYGDVGAMKEIINNVKEKVYRNATSTVFGDPSAKIISDIIDRTKYPEAEIQAEYNEFFDAISHAVNKTFTMRGGFQDEDQLNEAVQKKVKEIFLQKIELDYKPPHRFQTDLNGAQRVDKVGPLMRNSLDVLLPEGDARRKEFFAVANIELATVNAPSIQNVTDQVKYTFDYDRELNIWKNNGGEEKLFPFRKARLLTVSAFGANPIFIAVDEDNEVILWRKNSQSEEDYLMWTIEEINTTPPNLLPEEDLTNFTIRKTEEEYNLLMKDKIKEKAKPEDVLKKKGFEKAFRDGKITEEKYLELIKDL